MPPQLEICLGFPAVGKTTRLLQQYREVLIDSHQKRELGGTLWLAPTRSACREIEKKLPADQLRACGQPQIMTFDDFAERILSHAALSPETERILPITRLERRWIVRRLLDRLYAGGQLPHFSSVVDTSGFLDLVIDFIVELKREELWPDRFLQICEQREKLPADRELGLIYDEYQSLLNEHHRYDAEGRFWSALSLIQQGHWKPFDRLRLVVVDGFGDFTSTQHKILESLSHRAGSMLISLPYLPNDARRDLFSRSAATHEKLIGWQQRGVKVSSTILSDQEKLQLAFTDRSSIGIPFSTHFLAAHLFADTRNIPRGQADGIEIVETIGPDSELRFLATRIKRLIKEGTPPHQIAVVYRTMNESTEMLQEQFDAAQIPYITELDLMSHRDPWLKSLLSILLLEAEDWPFVRLEALLHSTYFRPRWSDWKTGESSRLILKQLRRRKLAGERLAILRSLKNASERHASSKSSDASDVANSVEKSSLDGQPEEIATVYRWLNRLSEALAPLRTSADLTTWIDRLAGIAGQLGFLDPLDDIGGVTITGSIEPGDATTRMQAESIAPRDHLATWEYIKQILYDLAGYESLFSQHDPGTVSQRRGKRSQENTTTNPRLTFTEFLQCLNDIIRSTPIPRAHSNRVGVQILSAQSARQLEIPYLFLAGMNEGAFPLPRRENCLYNEQERVNLKNLGVPFSVMQMHRCDEMNLFYSVVTRFRRSLVISYSSVDAGGQPLYPSPYVTTLQELFDSQTLKMTQFGCLDPIPDLEDVICVADLRIRATLEVYANQPGYFRRTLDMPMIQDVSRNILASASTAALRSHPNGFSPFEGMLVTGQSLSFLNQHYHQGREYSTSELEDYATCPFRYFLGSLLNVEPLESPEPETDYRRRGILVHQILSMLLRDAGDETSSPAELSPEALVERFRALVTDRMGKRIADSRLQDSLNQIERELLNRWGETYKRQWHEYIENFASAWGNPPVPDGLEIPFGAAPDESSDQVASKQDNRQTRYPALMIGTNEKKLAVRGRIDRIDVGSNGALRVFNVVDYKTGNTTRFSFDDVKLGRSLQLVLYALAVQRLGIAGADAHPYQMLYWSIKNDGFEIACKSGGTNRRKHDKPLDRAVWNTLVEIVDRQVPRLVDLLKSGQFPVFNASENCTQFCEYRTVCRIHQIRSLGKTWRPFDDASDSNAERGVVDDAARGGKD